MKNDSQQTMVSVTWQPFIKKWKVNIHLAYLLHVLEIIFFCYSRVYAYMLIMVNDK